MRKISEFVKIVQFDSKKRTGIVLAGNQFQQAINAFAETGLTVVDCADYYHGDLILTDDQLVNKLRSAVSNKATLVSNVELFIAPRMNDGFLDHFIRKMAAEEPSQAVIILLYSELIFRKFDQLYQRNSSNHRHTLDLTDEARLMSND